MNIFFMNAGEMRSILSFNRISNSISETLRRLETGQRILSGKDDPAGIFSRDMMRADIRGIQSAQKNTTQANEFLSMAESGLASISRMLIGDINNRDDNGLIGLIYDTTLPADMKQHQINDILSLIDGVARTTNYNGKRMLDGSLGYRISGVDSSKLSGVSVTSAAPGQGQPVTLSVLEHARQGTFRIDPTTIDTSVDFNVQLTGVSGESVNIAVTGSYNENDILNAVNAKTGETGVRARIDGTRLLFETLEVGSNQSFSLKISNGTLNIDKQNIAGRDVLVRINGEQVRGKGWQVDYTAHDLSMSATISPSFQVGDRTQFQVAGGALFQLGQNVQESMQYRMAIPSMTVSHLGGASGRLHDLRSIDLETDEGKALAYAIVTEAVNMIAVERGKIGAVQKHVLTANSKNLDTLHEKVSEAEGLLSNADMALESSRLSRAELLAQSALSAILYSRDFGQFILRALL